MGVCRQSPLLFSVALAALLLSISERAQASCDQIPGTANSFRGSLGTVNRPFASPGDIVELRLSPSCDSASPGFTSIAQDHVVSVVFTPPEGARNLAVVAADCEAVEAQREECETYLGGGRLTCLPIATESGAAVRVIDRNGLRLQFHFPDTDGLAGAPDDQRTLSGPAAIAVSPAGARLPCALAERSCEEQSGLVACIGPLFRIDGTCEPTPHEQFGHFTALPPPNDAQALCIEPSSICNGRATELRLTTDAHGNALVPMDWRGVILFPALGIARAMNAIAGIPAFSGSDSLLRLPSSAFLRSFSSEGGTLEPVFEPRADPESGVGASLFGLVDAPRSILRISRRSPALRQCHGGAEDGRPCATTSECPGGSCGTGVCVGGAESGSSCSSDGECPGSECGSSLFDFSGLLAAGGSIVVPRFGPGVCQDTRVRCSGDAACPGSRCVAYRVAAEEPVPLEGLIQSPDLFVSVVPESLDGSDLNGDGDETDDVLLLADRRTGTRQPIGTAGAPGRAATRLRDLPFNYPVVTVENDLVAFLEAEPLQGNGDSNGDDDEADTLLRIYRSASGRAHELTAGLDLAVDAAPAIDERSVVISDGLVWFRTLEAANTRQIAERVSVASDGTEGDAASTLPALSADGNHVAFESRAGNLGSPAGSTPAAFVHDRRDGATRRVAFTSPYLSPDAGGRTPRLSGDGRFVVTSVQDLNGTSQIFILDRDADGNGTYDQVNGTVTVPVSTKESSLDLFGTEDSVFPSISPNGRYVTYLTQADELLYDFRNDTLHIVLRDRDKDNDGIFESSPDFPLEIVRNLVVTTPPGVPTTLSIADAVLQAAALSADGRYVSFGHFEQNLPPADYNNFCLNLVEARPSCADVLLADRERFRSFQLLSAASDGEQGNSHSLTTVMSAEGRFVAFLSAANNLVASDTNEVIDVFVHDRASGITSRVSVSSDGTQGDAASFDRTLAMSADGRYIAFASAAATLVEDDHNRCDNDIDGRAEERCYDVFVHDRLTGFTRRVSVAGKGTEGDGGSRSPSISADGSVIAFESAATNLVTGDTNGASDVFVAEPAPVGDLSGDGDANDAVLQAIDTRRPGQAVLSAGPATMVSVHDSCAAFLLPENALDPSAPSADRNGDGDRDDSVVHFFCNGQAEARNFTRAAVAVRLNGGWIAALVSEAGQGGSDLNDDGDTDDTVLQVTPRTSPEAWANTAEVGDTIAINETVVAFISPEAAAGRDLNGDGDEVDRVLQLYDLDKRAPIEIGQAAEELVLGDRLVAFRTSEAAQANDDLNGDGDRADAVLQVYDLEESRVINSRQAATPCRLPSCDPRFPYRVVDTTVKFLTLEAEQGEDLTGNGFVDQLVLQTFKTRLATGGGAFGAANDGPGIASGAIITVGAISAGICSDSGAACASNRDCGAGGACYVPPGVCVADLGRPCDLPSALVPVPVENPCPTAEVCVPTGEPGKGSCHARQGPCKRDADCAPEADCRDAGQDILRLVAPLAASARTGSELFVGSGRCVEDLGISCTEDGQSSSCGGGTFCGASGTTATCKRSHGTCRLDLDCPGTAKCEPELIVASAADGDGDGIADPFDNCPYAANGDQRDGDGNDIGDACQVVPPTPTPTAQATATSVAVDTSEDDGCTIPGRPRQGSATFFLLVAALALYVKNHRPRREPPRDKNPSTGSG